MASEKAMWAAMRPLLSGLDPVRVENMVNQGTPDVNYRDGWIELKYAPKWPTLSTTPLRVHHFYKEQRVWHIRRESVGGTSFVMLKVGEEWLLFGGEMAAYCLWSIPGEMLQRTIGDGSRGSLYNLCIARWLSKPSKEELQKWL
jgi:hypothetical protein